MKQLTATDYALYLNCMCEDYSNDCMIKLTPKNLSSYAMNDGFKQIQPILRPLEDMTENEAYHIIQLIRKKLNDEIVPDKDIVYHHKDLFEGGRPYFYFIRCDGSEWTGSELQICKGQPNVWQYLLSRHFDLFGWIDAKLAIDANTLRENPYGQDIRSCRVCGCTDNDCRYCIETTGKACRWVENDLCSACVDEEEL